MATIRVIGGLVGGGILVFSLLFSIWSVEWIGGKRRGVRLRIKIKGDQEIDKAYLLIDALDLFEFYTMNWQNA